ncbi:DUF4013 domain-containing protein [Halomicroarcula limicola]|uniref:DUF4013 domain-containing protein n=1 Tax=Haloarcula limicola TaxID=1429915 RepID=A0A8J7Y6X5_9EURY|nr:DUF4013 domain-containing protein [Halomicroarcula limicola]MBV0923206.1 DUF4013 domain-containing protein [Halomicroarcula limicola]
MLRDALSYPQRGPGWLWTVITGSLLTLAGVVLFVPLIPVQGYLLRVVRSTAEGRPNPPKFSDWGDLFLDGARSITVQVAYVFVPVMLLLGAVLAPTVGYPQLGTPLLAVAGFVGAVAAVALPAALARLATTDRLAAAFDARAIAETARQPIYVVAIVEAYVALFVIAGLGGVFVLILVGAAFAFYGQVVGYHLFARGYAGAIGDGQDPMA